MSNYLPTVWSEGMFLRPQHFQQQERYLSYEFKSLLKNLSPYSYGIIELKINKDILKIGQFSIDRLKAVLPDMTIIDIPGKDDAPNNISFEFNDNNSIIYLTLPLNKDNEQNYSSIEEDIITRYKYEDREVYDCVSGKDQEILQLGSLALTLKFTNESLSGYTYIPIAKVLEITNENEIILDENFIPPYLNVKDNIKLKNYVVNIISMTKMRADAISQRLGQGKSVSSSAVDFMMLQMLNRYEGILRNLFDSETIHPYTLSINLTSFICELSSFSSKDKRIPNLLTYTHNNLSDVFYEMNEILTKYLSLVLEYTATKIKLETHKYGIMVASLPDKKLLSSCDFILSIKSDISENKIKDMVPNQMKIGPAEHIRDIISNQINGIKLSPLSVVPRQLPYKNGFVYFEIEKKGKYWDYLSKSGGLALHLSGSYPNLEVELWSINQ